MAPRSPYLSDGEIASGDEEKAISTDTISARRTKVNDSARLASSSRASQLDSRRDALRSRSPYRRNRSRSRSPYRTDQRASGEKRRHEEDHYSRDSSDPRRFRVHYERDATYHRSSHRDVDRPTSARSFLSYDDETDRPRRRRSPSRSRSPPRFNHSRRYDRSESRSPPRFNRSRRDSRSRSRSPFRKANVDQPVPLATVDASPAVEAEVEPEGTQPKLTEAEVIEQRRKRREAIKAKHKTQPPLLVQALEQNIVSAPPTPAHDSTDSASEQPSPQSPRTSNKDSPPNSPAQISVNDDEELVNPHQGDFVHDEDEGPSAADYDPNQDMEEDRPEHKRTDLHKEEMNGNPVLQEAPEPASGPKPAKEFDMFAEDDDDDMFAATDNTTKPVVVKEAKALDASLLDNWDYPDGHYRILLGELLDGRYAVQQQIGKGTFATVVRALDQRTGHPVAVKIACNNQTMYRAGQKEMHMVELLNEKDPDDKKHIIRLERQFEHKGHLCLVFESLSADLREVLKKFGRNVGLNLMAIKSYAQQIFLALGHMKKCQVLHADLKPDNILVSEKRSTLKVCDLGTAAFADDAEITPYLVSRFYRAPEVILGIPIDYAIDMWSIGCTLFELYTGRILFAGSDNNNMLRVIQESRGKIPMRVLKKSAFWERHYDADGTFISQDRDKATGKIIARPLLLLKTSPGKDLKSRLNVNTKGLNAVDLKEHMAFVDLLDKCLQLDPARRITPNDALRHSFIHTAPIVPQKRAVKPALVPPPRLK